MKYTKAKIPIRHWHSVSIRDGYTFEVMFSDCTLFEVGVYHVKRDLWRITCMHTGYMICYAPTRDSAVEKFMEYYLSKYELYVSGHKKQFEQQCDELKELIADYEKGA